MTHTFIFDSPTLESLQYLKIYQNRLSTPSTFQICPPFPCMCFRISGRYSKPKNVTALVSSASLPLAVSMCLFSPYSTCTPSSGLPSMRVGVWLTSNRHHTGLFPLLIILWSRSRLPAIFEPPSAGVNPPIVSLLPCFVRRVYPPPSLWGVPRAPFPH